MNESDEFWMRECLRLALQAEGRTAPNPVVGAVVLSAKGKLVGQGYHRMAGTAHAEKIALAEAGKRAIGGTLFVNLEPCQHIAKRRTAPCAPLLLASGISRLVFGQRDPIRSHSGGARWLKAQGMEVVSGVLQSECKEANRAFNLWAKRKRPRFVLKAACSLDGKIATADGESQWITGAPARREGHALRNRLDGILVGIETVLADDPRLTARGRGFRDPIRMVVDTKLRTPTRASILPANGKSKAGAIVFCAEGASAKKARALEKQGAEVVFLPKNSKGLVSLEALAAHLGSRGILSVLVEGGGRVHGSFLQAGLCDELRLFVAPKVIGEDGKPWLRGAKIESLDEAFGLRFVGETRLLGKDLALRADARV